MSLITSKQLLQTFSIVLAIILKAGCLPDFLIRFFPIPNRSKDIEFCRQKVLQGDEYQNFSLKKKFFIHRFFSV